MPANNWERLKKAIKDNIKQNETNLDKQEPMTGKSYLLQGALANAHWVLDQIEYMEDNHDDGR